MFRQSDALAVLASRSATKMTQMIGLSLIRNHSTQSLEHENTDFGDGGTLLISSHLFCICTEAISTYLLVITRPFILWSAGTRNTTKADPAHERWMQPAKRSSTAVRIGWPYIPTDPCEIQDAMSRQVPCILPLCIDITS